MLRQVTGKGHLGIAKLLVESGYSLESIELAEEYLEAEDWLRAYIYGFLEQIDAGIVPRPTGFRLSVPASIRVNAKTSYWKRTPRYRQTSCGEWL
jgi:hypothetical protein